MNAIEIATLEEVTKDDETPAQPDQVDGLIAVAHSGSPEAQKEMAEWLTSRLGVDSIPVRALTFQRAHVCLSDLRRNRTQVKLKTLRMMTVLNGKGGANFKQELRTAGTGTVKGLVEFQCAPHPVHGDKPAGMVRNFAGQALKILELPAEDDAAGYAMKSDEGVGSFLSKKLAKAATNIAADATAAAAAASEAADHASAVAAAKAEEARLWARFSPF